MNLAQAKKREKEEEKRLMKANKKKRQGDKLVSLVIAMLEPSDDEYQSIIIATVRKSDANKSRAANTPN